MPKATVLSPFENASAAYSMRIPSGSSYNGNLIRVRRSSDNAEQDFGAVSADSNGNKWLDTTSILAFCGAGNGNITKWYDQSGNGRNLIETFVNAQPVIVISGVLQTFNSTPCINMFGNRGLTTPSFSCGVSRFTANSVFSGGLSPFRRIVSVISDADSFDASSNTSVAAILRTSNFLGIWSYRNGVASTSVAMGSSGIVTNSYDATGAHNSVNGSAQNTSVFSETSLGANVKLMLAGSSIGGGYGMTGTISEVLWFHSQLETIDKQRLEISQSIAYGITLTP